MVNASSLYDAINKRFENVAPEHTLDVSDAYKNAFIEDGKIIGIENEEKVYSTISDFQDKRFIERKTITGLYETLEYNDHKNQIFFAITKYLLEIFDPTYREYYYHSEEYKSIPKGAIVLQADILDERNKARKLILPDQNTCYTTTEEYDEHHHGGRNYNFPVQETEQSTIDEVLQILANGP